MWVETCASSLHNSFRSNVAKRVARFCCPFFPTLRGLRVTSLPSLWTCLRVLFQYFHQNLDNALAFCNKRYTFPSFVYLFFVSISETATIIKNNHEKVNFSRVQRKKSKLTQGISVLTCVSISHCKFCDITCELCKSYVKLMFKYCTLRFRNHHKL